MNCSPDSMKRGIRSIRVGLFLVAVLPAARGLADEPLDPSAETIILKRCALDFEKSATVGSSVHSLLQECLVQPGQQVKAGQVLGRIRDSDARAELQLRQSEAESDIGIRLSEARLAQAASKVRRTHTLLQRNAVSQEEFQMHKTEAESYMLEVEQAKYLHRLAQIRFDQAKDALRERELVSPFEGMVVAVLKRRGEPVTTNDPLFKVVDIRDLLVTGQADVTDIWRLRVGQAVRVVPDVAGADLAVEHISFKGQIVFVDTKIDPLSQTCKVVARVQNANNLLRAGLEARMEILPEPPPKMDNGTAGAGASAKHGRDRSLQALEAGKVAEAR
jgi:RND family efflux transporter MFP subunit